VDADTENRWLVRELEKGQALAHANIKRLLRGFREATTAEIQVHTTNALKEWCEQIGNFVDPDFGSWIKATVKPLNKI
jgi:hypothetical protein